MAKGKKKEKIKKLLVEATDPTQITHTQRLIIYHFRCGRKRLQLITREKEKERSFSWKLVARERKKKSR
jgi:hypothetical protein